MEKTVLTNSKYPKIVTDLATQNHFLKILTYSSLGIITLMLLMLIYSMKRGPDVIALETSGEVAKVETQITDLQVQTATKEYLKYRYTWDSQSVAVQIKKSEAFIQSSLISSFQRSMLEVQKFVKDKKVVQRVYPQKIEVDFKTKSVTVVADRITEFESLKAATVLKVKLNFDLDDRTPMNPWGVYFTKEVEGGE